MISMTAMQEARLAREAELCYALMALVTDYDCWHESLTAVDIGKVLRVMRRNVEIAQKAIAALAGSLAGRERTCLCPQALKDAIVTHRQAVSDKLLEELRPIIGKYVGG